MGSTREYSHDARYAVTETARLKAAWWNEVCLFGTKNFVHPASGSAPGP